jgi:hypothetical protein
MNSQTEMVSTISNKDTMSEVEQKELLEQERYFRYSWTHAFFNWKCHRIMAGEKVRTAFMKSN